MSHQCYNELWKRSMELILANLDIENPQDTSTLPKDIESLKVMYTRLYLSYIGIYTDLEDVFDQMTHPQKLILVRKILEAIMGRLLEIKEVLLKAHGMQQMNFEAFFGEVGIEPSGLEIPVPRYFVSERAKELQEREKLLNALLVQYTIDTNSETETPATMTGASSESQMTIEEAILIIQINERGYQGRMIANKMKELRASHEQNVDGNKENSAVDQHRAATLIQKVFRGHLTRLKTEQEREKQLIFIGMKINEEKIKERYHIENAEATQARRKLIQSQNKQEYKTALVTIRKQLVEHEGPVIMERIQDEVRTWFIGHKEQTGRFPAFPSDAEGGSANLFKPRLALTKSIKDEKEKNAKKQTNAKKLNAKTAVQDAEKEEIITIAPPSVFLADIHECSQEYTKLWRGKDDRDNFAQKYDPQMVKDMLYPDVEREIRLQADAQLREELELLRIGVEKGKKGKSKGRRNKSPGGTTRRKRTKKEDTFAGERSVESLFAELVQKKLIIKISSDNTFSMFQGSYNFAEREMLETGFRPNMSYSELRQRITEICVMTLGSKYVHMKFSPQVRSVLLYGPPGTGKTMLSQAIANATGAVFLDLSYDNIANNMKEKESKNLIQLVFKVAKLMQPAVIYIDGIEKYYGKPRSKKVVASEKPGFNKDESTKNTDENGSGPSASTSASREYFVDPLKLRPLIIKQIKMLKPEHQVLIVGNSNSPWTAQKGFISFFDKFFYVTYPDYATRRLLWLKFIEEKEVYLSDSFNLSILINMSEGYSAGAIKMCVDTVLSVSRIQLINKKKPLIPLEFIEIISNSVPYTKNEDDLFKKFHQRILEKEPKMALEEKEEDTDSKKKSNSRRPVKK